MTDILLDAFLVSLILLGIHSYFGREIIRRGVIFTDLAIAQSASVGVTLSLFFHREELIPYLSVAFAFLGGFLVFLSEKRESLKEALVGLVYAGSVSLGFLLLSKSAHGAEDFLRLTANDILFTPTEELIKTGTLYIFLGLLIYLRERYTKGLLSDLLFYLLFALTVSSSVKLAGVLVVFSLLLAPALVSIKLRRGLFFAWVYGSLINIIAILGSYHLDLPTGFSIVFLQSLCAFALTVFKR